MITAGLGTYLEKVPVIKELAMRGAGGRRRQRAGGIAGAPRRSLSALLSRLLRSTV